MTSCADDDNVGTLRNVISVANSGDIIELAGLHCSTITLTQGGIPALSDDLTIHGPGAQALAIDGGGIDRVFVHYGYGTLVIAGLTVRNGINHVLRYKVAGGACIIGNNYVTLDHSVVTGCSSVGEGAYGGAILARHVTLYTSALVNNVAQGSLLNTLTAAYGGGLFAYRNSFALNDSLISGNRASIDPANTFGSYDTGGGVFSDDGGTVVRSTVAANYTDGNGAGIATHGAIVISNSTISGNTAKERGGGVFARSTVDIGNSTLTRNTAAGGGGVYLQGQTQAITLQSTIAADNNAGSGPDIAATYAVTLGGANNLVIAGSSSVTLPPGTLRVEPVLLPLANNGGPTPTHALGPNSPAIDHGNNSAALDTDQRGAGFARVRGGAADIGAFESAPAAPAAPVPAPIAAPWMLGILASLLAWAGIRRQRWR